MVTCFPNTWVQDETYNLKNVIKEQLNHNKDRHVIESGESLFHLILKTSLDFFHREGPLQIKLKDAFQSSIDHVAEEQAKLFRVFKRIAGILNPEKIDADQRTEKMNELFSLQEETALLVEIMDIQDELNIILSVLTQQKDALDMLLRLYPKRKNDEDDPLSKSTGKANNSGSNTATIHTREGEGEGPEAKGKAKSVSKEDKSAGKKKQGTPHPMMIKILKNHALLQEVIDMVVGNISAVMNMLRHAGRVQEEV